MTTEITSAGGARRLTAMLRHEEQVLAILAAVLAALIAWEVRRFAELRERLRRQIASDTAPA